MSEGFPIDEYNRRLALDRVKSISVMSALTDTEGLNAKMLSNKNCEQGIHLLKSR